MKFFTIRFAIFCAALLSMVPAIALGNAIDAVYKYAWGENVGWLNFGTPEGGVDVGTSTLTGYAWGENVGWISLNCSNGSSCATVDYKISNSGGTLTGYAWGENVGWISFSCSNTSSCASVNYGVTVNTFTGEWTGYAWGENVGWISTNCSNTSSCGTVNYHVANVGSLPPPGAGKGGAIGPGPGVPPAPLESGTPIPTISPVASPQASRAVSPPPLSTVLPVTATPVASAAPAPAVSPPAQPPSKLMPPAPPLPITPSIPAFPGIVVAVQRAGQLLDSISQAVFSALGSVAPLMRDWCGSSGVQATACGSTAVGVVATAVALAAAVVQQEIAGATYAAFQIMGLRRKARVWGVVYDAATKRPIPYAKVILIGTNGRVLESRFADRDGRYGFLTSPESMHQQGITLILRVEKVGYTFPTKMVTGESDYIVYDRIYRGGPVVAESRGVINLSIPMDPISSRRVGLGGFGVSLIGKAGDRILAFGFYVGLVAVPVNYYMQPSPRNLIIMIAFFAVNLFRILVVYRPYGMSMDAATGKPMPFALIVLNDAQGDRVSFTVSDEYGRFILSGPSGQFYNIVAHTPANATVQRSAATKTSRLRGRGWITSTIRI